MTIILWITRRISSGARSLNHLMRLTKKESKNYVYLTIEEVIEFNLRITGIQGQLRDPAGLEGAMMRPQMASHYEMLLKQLS